MANIVPFDDAFRADIEPFSGWWSKVQSSVRRSVSALTRNASGFYIGIASSGDLGCRQRWNQKYKQLGYASMAAVFVTSSDRVRRAVESDLIEYYEDYCDNLVGGGGGGAGSPNYVVYVVW